MRRLLLGLLCCVVVTSASSTELPLHISSSATPPKETACAPHKLTTSETAWIRAIEHTWPAAMLRELVTADAQRWRRLTGSQGHPSVEPKPAPCAAAQR